MQSLIAVRGKDIRIDGRVIRIARLAREKHEVLTDPEPMLDELRKSAQRVDLFTFVEGFPDTQPKYDYSMELDNLAVLPVTTYEEWFKHQIRFAPRGRLRQAEKKGVTAREVPLDDILVRGIWEIYNEAPVVQGKRSRHYGNDLQTVHKKEATFQNRSVFVASFLDGEVIGFLKLVLDEPRKQAKLIEMMSLVRHRDKCPANALIAQAVRSCADRGIRHLIYEKLSYGKKAGDGLAQFKEVNGFKRIDIPRYYVPLTGLGSLALKTGLHRRLADHLPLSLANRIREVRTAWYHWKFRAVFETSRR